MRIAVAALIISAAAVPTASSLAQAIAGTLIVSGDAAMLTVAIHPSRTAEFDRVLERARSVLARSQNPRRRAQAAGWQVFKSEEMQGTPTYVMRFDPAVGDTDYSLATIVAEGFPSEEIEIRRLLREIVVSESLIWLKAVPITGLGDFPSTPGDLPAGDARVPVLSFDTAQAVVITILVRADREGDFTSTLGHLGKAIQASPSATRQRQAAGWKVLKGTELLGGNVVYVMSLDPVVPRAEYDPIRLIQESFPAEVDSIFKRYRDAFVGQAVSRLTNRIEMSK